MRRARRPRGRARSRSVPGSAPSVSASTPRVCSRRPPTLPSPASCVSGGAASELSGRAGAASLQRLGLGGEWRPFRNRFRLNFAMFLEPDDPGVFRTRKLAETGSASDDPVPLGDFEAVSYVGLGWRTNAEGLDVNLGVGAFLSEESFPRGELCPGSRSTLTGCGAASLRERPGQARRLVPQVRVVPGCLARNRISFLIARIRPSGSGHQLEPPVTGGGSRPPAGLPAVAHPSRPCR